MPLFTISAHGIHLVLVFFQRNTGHSAGVWQTPFTVSYIKKKTLQMITLTVRKCRQVSFVPAPATKSRSDPAPVYADGDGSYGDTEAKRHKHQTAEITAAHMQVNTEHRVLIHCFNA